MFSLLLKDLTFIFYLKTMNGFSLHPKLRATSATRVPAARSQNAVFLSFMDSPGRRSMLARTEFSSNYCNTNNSHSISNIIFDNNIAGLPQHVHILHFKILLIRSNRGIIHDTVDMYM